MEPYYLITDPHDDIAVSATCNRKSDYRLWKEIKPSLEDDFDISCHILAGRDARRYLVPVGRYRVPTGADIGYRG